MAGKMVVKMVGMMVGMMVVWMAELMAELMVRKTADTKVAWMVALTVEQKVGA